MEDILFAQGNIKNVLRRIGEYKSNLFCIGEDPVSKSGVIISKGEIVSSKILDITVKNDNDGNVISLRSEFLNRVEVKYVDNIDKEIKVMSFRIFNDEALDELIQNILKNREESEKLENIEKNIVILDEKLRKTQEFLVQNKNEIECIGSIKNELVDLRNKVDLLLNERQYTISQ